MTRTSNDTSKDLLTVEGLTVEFKTREGWFPAVRNLSFSIRREEVFGLVGESGSGKSVSAMGVLGLLPRRAVRISGSARLGDTELVGASTRRLNTVRGSRIGMIFQEPMTSLNPSYTIGEQIAESVRRHRGATRKQATQRAVDLLGRVGIPNAARNAERYPHHFSGGMRQRAMIAMALACDPELLIADEPTTALDVTVQARVLDLLAEIQADSGFGVLLITHDLAVVAEVADRVGVMYGGELVECAPTVELFEQPQHPYTSGLLSAIVRVGAEGEFATIKGSVPPITLEYPGCRFADRCAFAADACTRAPVPAMTVADQPHQDHVHDVHMHRCIRAEELQLGGVS